MLRCDNCGKENPDDSKFCQYCGSDKLEKIIDVEPNKKYVKGSKIIKIYSVLLTVVLICIIAFGCVFYNNYISLEQDYYYLQSDSETWHSDSDQLKRFKESVSNSYNDYFFADKNVLVTPMNSYVRVKLNSNRAYTVTWHCPSDVYCEWHDDGNDYDNTHWLKVRYLGSGIREITITNNINDEIIHITILGN